MHRVRKTYGGTLAVDDLSMEIAPGEIYGILGPNGADKTTAVEMLTGLRSPDRGSVTVLGVDPALDRGTTTELVGVQLQRTRLPEKIRVSEAVRLYRSFYRDPVDDAELLDRLGLTECRHTRYRALSGGQQQRLAVALALIGRPRPGLWLPRQSMPHILASISNYTPLGAAIWSMTAAAGGEPLPWAACAVLAGYGVGFSYLANRWFRWA